MYKKLHLIVSTLFLAAIFLLTPNIKSSNAQTSPFDDVQGAQDWNFAIYDLMDEGYITGRGDDTFDPYASMTRAEIAVLMLKAENGSDYQPTGTVGDWHEKWIAQAQAEGFMHQPIDPTAPATRADIATLMWLLTR